MKCVVDGVDRGSGEFWRVALRKRLIELAQDHVPGKVSKAIAQEHQMLRHQEKNRRSDKWPEAVAIAQGPSEGGARLGTEHAVIIPNAV